jgi:hypothetical protein
MTLTQLTGKRRRFPDGKDQSPSKTTPLLPPNITQFIATYPNLFTKPYPYDPNQPQIIIENNPETPKSKSPHPLKTQNPFQTTQSINDK